MSEFVTNTIGRNCLPVHWHALCFSAPCWTDIRTPVHSWNGKIAVHDKTHFVGYFITQIIKNNTHKKNTECIQNLIKQYLFMEQIMEHTFKWMVILMLLFIYFVNVDTFPGKKKCPFSSSFLMETIWIALTFISHPWFLTAIKVQQVKFMWVS